jgi:hypothetical protein
MLNADNRARRLWRYDLTGRRRPLRTAASKRLSGSSLSDEHKKLRDGALLGRQRFVCDRLSHSPTNASREQQKSSKESYCNAKVTSRYRRAYDPSARNPREFVGRAPTVSFAGHRTGLRTPDVRAWARDTPSTTRLLGRCSFAAANV